MHILMLNHEFPPVGGGAGNASKHIARELVRLGHTATMLTASFRDLPREENSDGVRVLRVPALRARELEASPLEIGSFVPSALLCALPLIDRERPDVIHPFFGIPSGAIGYALKRLRDLPYVISFRGRDVHGGNSDQGLSRGMQIASRTIWKSADALVANSRGLRRIALETLPEADVEVIPNGIDTDRFTPHPLPNPGGPVRLLFAGRLEPYKGVDYLLQAIRSVRKRTKRPLTLQVVGDGSMRNRLPRMAGQFGLLEEISFRGPVAHAEMPSIYRSADLFVLPSTVEGMPNVILEAMAAGLPVLATRIPGSEELVHPEETGLLVPPANSDALSQALLRLMENDQLRRTMGAKARVLAEERSWRQTAVAYLHLYERISRKQP